MTDCRKIIPKAFISGEVTASTIGELKKAIADLPDDLTFDSRSEDEPRPIAISVFNVDSNIHVGIEHLDYVPDEDELDDEEEAEN